MFFTFRTTPSESFFFRVSFSPLCYVNSYGFPSTLALAYHYFTFPTLKVVKIEGKVEEISKEKLALRKTTLIFYE